MSKLEMMHVEYLKDMVNHKNEDWAKAAYDELKELKDKYKSKGIIII